jgi:hypothetical protein
VCDKFSLEKRGILNATKFETLVIVVVLSLSSILSNFSFHAQLKIKHCVNVMLGLLSIANLKITH